MDDRATRAAHAQRLRDLVTMLEIDGGDAVAVLLGQAERLWLGVDRYGALDLDKPHDWQLEEDEERCDVENYRAIRRLLTQRGRSRSAARRDTTPHPLDDLTPFVRPGDDEPEITVEDTGSEIEAALGRLCEEQG